MGDDLPALEKALALWDDSINTEENQYLDYETTCLIVDAARSYLQYRRAQNEATQ